MRARIIVPTVFALGLGLLAGCGDRNLVVNVDVLSYLDPAVTRLVFGPLPAAPGGVYTGEVAIVKDVAIHMVERPNDLTKVSNVSLTIEAQLADSTGAGSDTLRLYLSDEATDPLTTPAIATLPVDLVDGQADTMHVDVVGDQRLADVFNATNLRLTVTNALRGPSSGAPLNGRVTFTVIRATVIAGRKGL